MFGRLRTLIVSSAAVLFALSSVGCGEKAPEQAVDTGGEPGAPELKVVDADDGEGFDYDYLIPFGTGYKIDDGEEIEIVPSVLNVKVGERIRIVNDDVQGANVGIFWVPAGRTVTMEFTTAGTLSGECDVHPDGTFTINVNEA